jgi:hypothetical protein
LRKTPIFFAEKCQKSQKIGIITSTPDPQNKLQGAKFDPATGKRMYDDYKLIRVVPKTEEDLNVLRFLEKGNSDFV